MTEVPLLDRAPRTLPVLLAFVDSSGRYAFVDEAYGQWFSTSPEEIVGRRVADVVGPAAWETIRHHVEAALSGEKVSFEQLVPYTGAGDRYVSVDYVPKRGRQGEVEGFHAIIRDVTQRKALEIDLARAQKMEAIGSLASAIAHDFRNTLMSIHGTAAVVRDALGPEHPEQERLAEIQRTARAGSDAVRDLLSFARPSPSEQRPVEVDAAVRGAGGMLRQLCAGDVELRIDLGAPGAGVRCGPGQIEQMLVNLGLNARDAMPRGGTLAVRTEPVDLDLADVVALPDLSPGPYVRLSVRDTGVGMSPETLTRVLEPFYTTKDEGTGLGLFSVFGTTRRCGGHIRIESEPGEGTLVETFLPRASIAELGREAGDAPPDVSSLAVLVVEDEDLVRYAVRHFLEKHGCVVHEAAGAEAALAIASERPPIDVAVVDVTLRSARGPGVVATLEDELGPLPVVYVSAYPHRILVEDGHLRDEDVAIEKPFDEGELLEAIGLALGTGAQRDIPA